MPSRLKEIEATSSVQSQLHGVERREVLRLAADFPS
jgi:hypothetical protein